MEKIPECIKPHRATATIVRIPILGIIPVQIELPIVAIEIPVRHIAGRLFVISFLKNKTVSTILFCIGLLFHLDCPR